MLPPGVNAPGTAAPGDVLTPKKQAVVERLRRRIESYRRRQSDFMPRFGQSFNGLCEQNIQDTLLLKQKYLENKSKRAAKKQEKKQPEQVNNLIAQQKFLKRPAEEDGGDYGESGPKLPCGAAGNSGNTSGSTTRTTEGLTKFSVEIVQQLEFTTSAANSQPQQISTNVTVKALTNASVKSTEEQSSRAPTQQQQQQPPPPSPVQPLLECKQEPDSEFVDLEQCAAALEKDAQNNNSFPGFSELIGNEGSDEIITSDAFKDLISEISDLHPELMKDFDFGENMMKVEIDSKEGIVPQQNYQQYENNSVKSRIPSYSGLEFGKGEMSPAAQTLKQMAEQHQHKSQLGMGFPSGRTPRSPYADYQFQQGEYKNQSTNTAQTEIKQEVNFSATQTQSFQAGIRSPGGPKTPTNMMGGYKQQYSPYSSPGGHSSPGYMPRGQGPGPAPQRPPSAPNGPTLQMSQNQQMHINQQSPGPQIQVSAGQHMQLNSEAKGGVSIAAQQQQGMYFSPSGTENSYNLSQSQTINFTQQSLRQRVPSEQLVRTGLRPPPPDYKPSPQQHQPHQPLMHSMAQARFPPQTVVRRPGPGQQPMPPSGPMMRPQMAPGSNMYMSGMPRGGMPPGAGYMPRHRPPNINIGGDGMNMGPGRGVEGMSLGGGGGRVPDVMSMGRVPDGMSVGPGRGPESMGMGQGRIPDGMSMGPGRGPESMSMGPGRGPESMSMGPGRGPESMSMGPGRGPESMSMGPGRGPESMSMGPGRGGDGMSMGPGRGPETMGMGPGRGPETMGMGPGRGPDGMGMGGGRERMEWRHVVMSQQQNASFSSHGRTFNTHPGNFSMGGNPSNMQQMHSQPRNQMSIMPQMMSNHVSPANQMTMNLQMSQSQSMSVGNGGMNPGNSHNPLQFHHVHSFPMQSESSGHSHMNGMNDLGLEFLDNLSSDTQDLFGDFDSQSNFNINDIL